MDEAKAIIQNLLEQIYQMRDMFDDADGSIDRACEEAEDFLEGKY